MSGTASISRELINKYNQNLPRYTSYPTAPNFHNMFTEQEYKRHAQCANQALLPRALSVYVHIPFCHSLCYFCACNKIITQTDNHKVRTYLDALFEEVRLRAELFDDDRLVNQIHFGGGTPTFLDPQQLQELLRAIARHFHLDLPSRLEISIEVDPRSVMPEDIKRLAGVGFNRFSIGVQDFSPQVQKAINRHQNLDHTLAVIEAAQQVSESVNIDLITGLPKQTVHSVHETLKMVISTGVSRIAAYGFAYLPDRVKAQKLIVPNQLPDAELRLELNQLVRGELFDAGYQHIGIDHYTLPCDSLYQAFLSETLQRNFQGYTTHAETDLIGVGVSAISSFKTAYAQNETEISKYQQRIKNGRLPIMRGVALNEDDQLRSLLIQQIMCRGKVDLSEGIFNRVLPTSAKMLHQYFAREFSQLSEFEKDKLVERQPLGFRLTRKGRFFARQIAATFDAYLQHHDSNIAKFSRAL